MHFGRRVLIDNATLTGVERIVGRISVLNTYNVEGDILCLESLLQSILLYDEIFFVDDYKEEHRKKRSDFFKFLTPLELQESKYKELEKQARHHLSKLTPVLQSGRLKTDELSRLLELIDLNLVFTWDMTSSEFYLTLKILAEESDSEIDKYGELCAMIKSGFAEQKQLESEFSAPAIKVLDHRGMPIDRGIGGVVRLLDGISKSNGLDGSTKSFLSGLSWLCYKTLFYRLAAEASLCDLMLHPIRHSCLATTLPMVYQEDPSRYRPIIDAMNTATSETVSAISSMPLSTVIKHPLPLFSVWLANKGLKPHSFIESALELRSDPQFTKVRKQFHQLEAVHTIQGEGKFKTEANTAVQELFKTLSSVRTKFGITSRQGIPITPLIWTYNIVGSAHGAPPVPNVGAKLPPIKEISDFWFDKKPKSAFSALFKNVVEDLAQIPRLGAISDTLREDVKWMPDAEKFHPKRLDPKFLGKRANWTAPME